MKLGIVGMPNVGKSTLFNALTNAQVPSENYPFCTIEPNVGTVAVPDEKLFVLEKLYSAKKRTHAVVNFVDIAGLVKGASKGEGLGNKFLSHIREVDAIVHMVRCFTESEVIHVDGTIDPARDIDTINTELILSDIEALQKRIEKSEKAVKASGDKKEKERFELSKKLLEHLSSGNLAKTFTEKIEDKELLAELFLLTDKPVIYIANMSENDISAEYEKNPGFAKIQEIAAKDNSLVIPISANIEKEISELPEEDKKDFLKSLGFDKSGLDRLIVASYKLLGLMSYYTAGEQEVRAWTIEIGTKAPQAAGKIHTDFEKGFIRAEIVNYNDLITLGSTNACKEAGKLRVEGKEYVMREDDVVLFRFNV
jgi:ribosome-binding ATPase